MTVPLGWPWVWIDGPSYSANQNGVDVSLSAAPSEAELRWYSGDGIGIAYNYENHEIEKAERLQILFGGATQLSAIYVSDLFYEDGYYETGSYRIHNGTWQAWESFDATLPGTGDSGEHVIVFDTAITVTGLRFKAPGKINGQDHEFSLLGLDAAPAPIASPSSAPAVPEPSSFALSCVGVLAMASTRRVRRA
jgi:hypothetical protein